MNIIIIAGFSLCLFFIVLILGKKLKQLSDYVLITWFGVTAFHFLTYYFEVNAIAFFNLTIEISGAFVLLHGPLILLYLILIHQNKKPSTHYLWHFLPFVIYLFLVPYLYKYDYYSLDITLAFLKLLSGTIYPIIVLIYLNNYNIKITQYYSELESKQLSWLKMVAFGILSIAIIGMISLIVTDVFLTNIPLNGELYVVIFLFLFVFIIGFYGLQQTSVFIDTDSLPVPKAKQINPTSEKYQKTGLTTETSINKFEEVKQYVINMQSFLDPEISLYKLAGHLQMPANQLSQIINQNADKNFFSFINAFRVETVKQKINNGEHKQVTLLSIALSSGFNSKSSFNRTFKQITGLTPSQYIEQGPANSPQN